MSVLSFYNVGLGDLNSGHQACWQAPLPPEPPHWPYLICLKPGLSGLELITNVRLADQRFSDPVSPSPALG